MSEVETSPARAVNLISGAEHAPIIAFDGVSAVGSSHGTFTFGLVAGRPIPLSNGTIPNVVGAVAYLKCNAHALQELRAAIDGAIGLAAKQQAKAAEQQPAATAAKPAPAATKPAAAAAAKKAPAAAAKKAPVAAKKAPASKAPATKAPATTAKARAARKKPGA
ncbi:hypothetical protein [Chelatococcus reniformis]|uniref:Uncharacterized protein n=1 Tax=Chelatococcus reniformis TaxID=1494448 RepID=A0A916U4Y7_9HYPH|nr:hypothetical protein [Chelatococcus reniformis]GGC60498.1 hypothetical protein GCM10010994_18920 [Chelatococcus reniformis]